VGRVSAEGKKREKGARGIRFLTLAVNQKKKKRFSHRRPVKKGKKVKEKGEESKSWISRKGE